MIAPIVLLILSLAAIAAALTIPGHSDLLLPGGVFAIVSLVLLVLLRLRRRPRLPARRPNWILVDGSNVMHWREGTPQIEPLREVILQLDALGFAPGVVFDANVGYKLVGRYLRDDALGTLLALPVEQVIVVPKGMQADEMLLAVARDYGARIVSNDRFRDRAEAYPEVTRPGALVRGGYRAGALWLDLEEAGNERH